MREHYTVGSEDQGVVRSDMRLACDDVETGAEDLALCQRFCQVLAVDDRTLHISITP